MRLAILSAKTELHSTQRLLAAAHQRDIDAQVINPLHCSLSLTAEGPVFYYQNQPLAPFAAALPRVGHELTFAGSTVLRQLEAQGTYSPTSAAALLRSRDKLQAMQALIGQVPMPTTAFANTSEAISRMVAEVGGTPLVIKVLEGSQGIGVTLAETPQSARATLEAFMGARVNVLVQEFIREAAGQDLRLLVVGTRVVAAMERRSQSGDFRANLHCGGKALALEPSEEECALAIKAAQILGLGIAGVDLLRSHRGPLLLEVNSSPGLEGIENATGVDVAGAIMDFIVAQCAAHPSRSLF
ncbi:RimK family alpha-L-glutamate ligase [Gallaecimonas mangrovi]|uniref:RimK family alpha-L-glutamate ligase n=1 Tax=Gallaecimonas mangrovi TaxID=2291597 RepID=UPI000E1FE6DE|nr:RimK family alpha-L-glutamate ligase [Gallaecimonas mangrovi]